MILAKRPRSDAEQRSRQSPPLAALLSRPLKWGDTVVCYNADFTGNLQLKTNRGKLEKKQVSSKPPDGDVQAYTWQDLTSKLKPPNWGRHLLSSSGAHLRLQSSLRDLQFKVADLDPFLCQRPYHAEYTSSRPITEVKQR